MKKSKLIMMLKTLSDSEIKEFGKFLEGLSFRKTGGVYLLYTYLKKWHPEFPIKKIDKEQVQKSLFKNLENTNKRLVDTTYQLSVSLEDFMIKKELEINDVDRDFLLLKSFRSRKLDKLFFQKIGSVDKKWEQKPVPGTEHLHDLYKLKRMCFLHPNYRAFNEIPLNVPDLSNLLDKYYFAIKLYWTICNHTTNNIFLNNDDEKSQYFIEEIIALSKLPEFQKMPQIRTFGNITNALINNASADFQRTKENFFKNLKTFDDYEQYDLLISMHHWCFENYKNGISESLQDLFELNCSAVEHKIVIEDGYIDVGLFRDIVNVGCAVKELEWTENFIKEFSLYLKEEEKMDITAICRANVAMNRQNFTKALQTLAVIKFQNPLYGIMARSIQLQCYYELEDYEELFSNLIKSFTIFLSRDQKVSTSLKESTLNFIGYAKKIQKAKERKLNISSELLNQINENNNVAWKKWLLEKAKEVGIKK